MLKYIKWIALSSVSAILLLGTFVIIASNRSVDLRKESYYKAELQGNDFTSITQKEILKVEASVKLLAGKTFEANFIAKLDNIGIISIPFDTSERSVNDEIIFRIKEPGDEGWYYQATYDARQIHNNIPFPFGFPIISNSKDKEYTFQIVSLNGTEKDSLLLKTKKYLYAKYKFSKSELKGNIYKLSQFLSAKAIEQILMLKYYEVIILICVLFFPFIAFVFIKSTCNSCFRLGKKIKIFIKILAVKQSILSNRGRKIFIDNFKEIIYQNSLLAIVLLLLITIFSRFLVSYNDKSNVLVAPESKMAHPYIGADYKTGVEDAVSLMLRGKNIYTNVQNYGSGFTLLTVPIYNTLKFAGVCENAVIPSCHSFLYNSLLILTIGGYLLLIILISYKNQEMLIFLLLYFVTFLLGVPGSFGTERGNIDIIISLILGHLILWIFSSFDKKQNKSLVIFQAIVVGIISAFLVNTKLFLLPAGLVAIYSSKKFIVVFLSFILAFFVLGYLPDVLFNSPSNPFSSINIALIYGFVDTFSLTYRLQYNYTFNAFASFFTNCVPDQTCKHGMNWQIITAISKLLFFFTFIFPFISTPFIKNRLINYLKTIRSGMFSKKSYKTHINTVKVIFQYLYVQRLNKNFVILLFIISVASGILLPEQTYSYRLYFVLPLLIILWKETKNNKKAKIYTLLSIACMSIKGFWIFMDVSTSGFNIFEARTTVLFVILGFYFMIKAGIELLIGKKQVNFKNNV